jgi:hypothetical protein
LEKWLIFYNNIVSPNLSKDKSNLARASEIKDLLETLSDYPFEREHKFRNLKKNEDLPRQEIVGAVQRFIYGTFEDSIIHSCFSVEIGLIVKLDAILSDEEKQQVPKPFTLAKIINYSSKFPRKQPLLVDTSLTAARAILGLRNSQIHGCNFITGIMLGYREAAKYFGHFNSKELKQGLEILNVIFPELIGISGKYKISDFIAAQELIKNMSTYEWCSNKTEIEKLKKELRVIFDQVQTDMVKGNIGQNLEYFQPDYFLKKRALSGLRSAFSVLKSLKIIS